MLLALLALNINWLRGNTPSLRPGRASGAAPDFTLPLLGGGVFHLRDGGAARATVIDFWASWCDPCREELPLLDRMWRERGGSVRFVAVNIEEADGLRAVRALVREAGLGLPIALGGGQVASDYGVDVLPHLVIVDGRGQIRKVLVGTHPPRVIAAAIDEAAGL